jgi:hypothetical protein
MMKHEMCQLDVNDDANFSAWGYAQIVLGQWVSLPIKSPRPGAYGKIYLYANLHH